MKAKSGEPKRWLLDAMARQGDSCMEWPFGRSGGYGSLRWEGRARHAHTVVCELLGGSPPSPKHTDAAHSCGNRLCVNPRHIRWATSAENQRDKVEHGTTLRGAKNAGVRLSEEDVRLVRASTAASAASLGRRFGISSQAVLNIRTGKTWAWLP